MRYILQLLLHTVYSLGDHACSCEHQHLQEKLVLNYYLLHKTLNIRTSRITMLFCLADDVNVDFRDVDNWKLFNFIITFAFWIRRDIDG